MNIISSILKTRSQYGYNYRRKLPAILLMLLILTPAHSVYAKNKKCIDDKGQYREMLYDIISKRIEKPRALGMCSIIFDVDLYKALIVGKIEYTDTPLCRQIIPIIADVSNHKLAECYIETDIVTSDGRWSYALVFGDGKH